MNLTELNPRWVGAGGKGVTKDGEPVKKRHGVGMSFECPCGCGDRVYLDFANPVDGGPSVQGDKGHQWERRGDEFQTMKLLPSIQRVGDCEWHGYIGKDIPGEVTTL